MTILEYKPNFFLKYRYWILSLLVFIIAFIHLIVGGLDLGTDFWEHAAVIRELATHPFSPTHPRLLANLPHAFFSPYALGIALIDRITGLTPIAILSIFSLFNITLFLLGLKLFIDSNFNKWAAFYVLLFILFLWGRNPWSWSSFFHLNAFLETASYPSFFCVYLTFFSLYIYTKIARNSNKILYIPLVIMAGIVLITHPTTAIILYVGLISLSIYYHNYLKYSDYLLLFSIIILSFGGAFIWPYFPFFDLIRSHGSEFNLDSKVLYERVFIKTFPVLIGVPIMIGRFKRNIFDPLWLMFLGLSFVYIYGGISQNYTFGRVISFIVLILQISIADWVSGIELKCLSGEYNHSLKNRLFQLAICGLFIMIIFKLTSHSLQYITNWKYRHSYKDLAFISKYTEQYDVILSDIGTSWVIPTFGGKVVAGLHAQAFIPDHAIRKYDLQSFFSEEATKEERIDIITKYKVNYILLNKTMLSSKCLYSFEQLGAIIYSKQKYTLIKINANQL